MRIRFFTGLRGRMLLSIGAVVLLGLGAIIAVVGLQVTRATKADALKLTHVQAQIVAADADATLNRALAIARSLADALQALTETGGTPDRSHADAIVRRVLEKNSQLAGVWTVWEPNAFDGRDAEFANQPGHDATGRYVPYWNRGSGQVAVEATKDYTVEGAGNFYLRTKKLDRESVIEPYVYRLGGRDVLITTLAVPIHDASGKVVAVAGVDLTLQTLADQISRTKVGAQGYAALISGAGLYVAHPSADRVGKPILESDPWVSPYLKAIRDGEAFSTTSFSKTLNSQAYRIGAPVRLGESRSNWCAVVSVPEVEVLASARRLALVVTVIGGAVLLGVLAVVWMVAQRIARPVREIAGALQQGAEQTAAASSQVSAASQSLAQGASEQAASLEETGASCEELASMTKRNAENATHAKALAAESRAAADGGATDMRQMAVAMRELKEAGASVAKIVKTIDEIAFQTNILALNAAVEAARAGEAGMGFAVVAEEVRNLAQRSAQAAQETAATIETTIQRSERGFALSEKVVTMLEDLVAKVRRVDDLVAQITAASNEQSQGISQINLALGQMDQVTQRTASEAEETASASHELSGQSEMLKATVARLIALVEGAGAEPAADARLGERPATPVRPPTLVRRGVNGHLPSGSPGSDRPPRSGSAAESEQDFFADAPERPSR